jgi:hypothetical protein
MKLKMVEPGYEGTFTGQFGYIDFVDGVSVEDVSEFDARSLACMIRFEWLDTKQDPGVNAKYQVSLDIPAPVEAPRIAPEEIKPVEQDEKPVVGYTEAQLEAIADKDGIAGLRVIGEPIGAKATSVAKLIQAILQAQRNQSIEPSKTEG